MQPVGPLIRTRRTQLGLSLEELALKIPCAKGYLSQIENERRERPPSHDLLRRIEVVLTLTPDRLVMCAVMQSMPPELRDRMTRLQMDHRLARRMAEIIGRPGPLSTKRRAELDELRAHFTAPSCQTQAGEHSRSRHHFDPIPVHRSPTEVMREQSLSQAPRGGGAPTPAPSLLVIPTVTDQGAFGVRLEDDSMAPDYGPGDIVVISPSEPPATGSDCLVTIGSDRPPLFRRLYLEGSMARLQPLNPAHPPAIMPVDRLISAHPATFLLRRTRTS